jgi:phospholipid/cholesterol/gamma-HCH transport system substrate-binding protein
MAAGSKTSWAQLKIGLVAAAALAALALFIILKTSTNPLFQQTSDVYAYFDDSFAMTEGATPVRLNGILVGKVKAIGLSGSDALNRAVKVTLSINTESLRQIPVDSTASMAQQNLLGARYINIKRGKLPDTVPPGGEIKTGDTTEIQDMLDQGTTTLSALQAILKRVETLVAEIEDGKGTIGKFLRDETLYNNLSSATDEMRKLVVAFNRPDSTLGHLINQDDLYQDFRGTMSRVNKLMDGLEDGKGTLGKLLKDDSLHEDVRGAVADLRKTLKLINEGDGTVGKLMTSDALHRQLEEFISRADVLMDKINSGEGTLGQLLVNPSLYESSDATMREVQGLMKDFRANPKKFLSIQLKLF